MVLKNRVAIITGASRGIGRAVALRFAQEGADVLVVAVQDLKEAEAVRDEIRAHGRRALACLADVSSRIEVEQMARAAVENLGKVDILVNNAGIIHPVPLLELPEDQWDRTLAVHLKGTFNCTQVVGAAMREKGYGRIINVTAPAALRATAGVADYASAKGGIIALTRAAAKELAPHGITVNCVLPVAETRMTDALKAFRGPSQKPDDSRFPLGRYPTLEEVAEAFVFFASEASRAVTGQVLAVDGGVTI